MFTVIAAIFLALFLPGPVIVAALIAAATPLTFWPTFAIVWAIAIGARLIFR